VTDVAERLARKGDRGAPATLMRLRLGHVGVWSNTAFAFVLSVGLNVVAVTLILLAARLLGDPAVLGDLTVVYTEVTDATLDLAPYLTPSTVSAISAAVVVVNTVLVTGLGAATAVFVNLGVRATGGTLLGFRRS
jgi:hypothetical protein